MGNRTAAGRYGVRLALALALAAALPWAGAQAVSADPVDDATVADRGSRLLRTEKIDDRQLTMHVYSASMDRDIPLRVITPADTSAPRPTLYLLNGAGGGEDSATWQAKTDVVDFFADKNVNVVTPMQGAFSYYTDWRQEDPELGNNKWTTFLTQELPPIVDAELGTNGVNSIAGISMAGSSVLSLAQSAPELYESVGAYSGCAMTSTDPGRTYVRMVVESRGGGDTSNMWGPVDDPAWTANDPYLNAEKLRGLDIYVSNGSGLPGPNDRLDGPGINGNVETFANQIILGGAIEAATNQCTRALADKLNELQIPATFDFRPVGTHSWTYWQEDLHKSWPLLASSIGV
ncbi:alpha/beta hydrolase [Rhodococcus sp. MSC1_016]|jgi:diacylglycerol O-acyltransferase/trehalose O-mycolyltransferase|uniref:alpha/beta hydrolase n=1 Tax=Rhodococcus sp. MSC1_016 TaxID=2909266 RepID=UPI00202F5236|nr:alpha/beta hydrolase family protein [Rhodococcus sp. MSC1_016]